MTEYDAYLKGIEVCLVGMFMPIGYDHFLACHEDFQLGMIACWNMLENGLQAVQASHCCSLPSRRSACATMLCSRGRLGALSLCEESEGKQGRVRMNFL